MSSFPDLRLHTGAFRDLAEKHNAITKKGLINKRFISKMTKSSDPHIKKMAILAQTFEKFHKKK